MTLLDELQALGAQRQGPVAAWSGLDVPLEVVEAAGFWPVRLTGKDPAGSAEFAEGGGHPLMRAIIGEAMSMRLESRDRLLFGSTPVTGVWMYNLLLSLGADAVSCPFELVDIERQDRPSSLERNRRSILAVIDSLSAAPEPLTTAIAARNHLRRGLRAMDALRVDRLSGTEARAIFAAADQAPATQVAELLVKGLPEIERRSAGRGTRVVYSGAGGDAGDLYRALEARGLRIVADDSDVGTRAIGPEVDQSVDTVAALAERYRRRDPAPAGWSTQARTAYLLRLAVEREAEAVVFDAPTYDHPSAWDLPAQIAALAKAGVQPIVLGAGVDSAERRADACLKSIGAAAHV